MPKDSAPDTGLRTLSEMVKLTGLKPGTFAWAAKEGFVSMNIKRQYALGATLIGLIRFLDSKQGVLPTYDNAQQCSAATGIPVSRIKAERRKSKDAFKNQMIWLGPLLKQIFASKQDKDWRGLQEKCNALKAQAELAETQGESLSKTEVSLAIKRGVSGFWFAFERFAEIEAPPDLKGCDEAGVRSRLVEAGKKLKATLTDELGKYMRNGETKGDNENSHDRTNGAGNDSHGIRGQTHTRENERASR